MKIRLIITLLLCLAAQMLRAQDTIFVYEEVYVYDTIYIHDTIAPVRAVNPLDDVNAIRLIEIDSVKKSANLLIISGERSATIPLDRIIISENIKNSNEMKKISFTSIMLFAVQNLLVAQTTFDVNIGTGAWMPLSNIPVVRGYATSRTQVQPTFELGAMLNVDFVSNLTLNTGLQMHYLMPNTGYKSYMNRHYLLDDDDDDVKYKELANNERYVMIWDEENGENRTTIGNDEGEADFFLIALPVKIGYRIWKFNPNIGVEYNYRISNNDAKNIHGFGVSTGFRFDLNDHIAFTTDYYYGLTKDMSARGTLYKYTTDTDSGSTSRECLQSDKYQWHTMRLEFGMHYKF